jgi:hypothetical protein
MKSLISHQKARSLTGAWFPRLKRGHEYPARGLPGLWVGYNGISYYVRPASR